MRSTATQCVFQSATHPAAIVHYRGRLEADGGPLAMIDHPQLGFLTVPLVEVACLPPTASFATVNLRAVATG